MATVSVEINGRPYSVGCADGQEDRVRLLARQFDESVRQVARDVGAVGDLRLFLMGALLLADELADLRGQVTRLRAEFERGRGGAEEASLQTARALATAAERIEQLLTETA
jgi:cell division protein ZapA